MNMYPGGDGKSDPTNATIYDIVPELSEMEEVNFPDPDFTPNYSTIIGQVDKIEVKP